jgi:Dual-action HEIGH metallo-peptidase
MKLVKNLFYTLVVFAAGERLFATTFIVPDDAELVQQSDAIITGVIVSANATETEVGYVETFYEVALDRVLKGPFAPRTIIRIQSPGGMTQNRFTLVESSAHFQIGDQVLLFLTPYRGGWTPWGMTLGKFRFAVTSGGHSVAIRDAEDIFGWDRDGKVHKEKVRLEAEFIHFIQETVAGGTPVARDHETEAGEVLAPPPARAQGMEPITELLPAPATTYSISFYSSCSPVTRYPGRWPTAIMNAGVPFYKNSAQDASGLGDGGVSIIQNALAAWTNDCGSAVNLQYGGPSSNLKDPDDEVNVIVFNDPGGHVPGGLIALTFQSGDVFHSFDGTDFVSLKDSDVIFNNGYSGTQPTIEVAMTHEIGHAIGLRHSDKHYLSGPPCSSETTCQPGVEDCSTPTNAVMVASVNSSLGFTLQTWDMSAADALYPGTCVTVLPPTGVVATATSTSNVNVSWTASAGAVTYNIYRSPDAVTYALAGSTTGPTVTFNDSGRSANTAYLYKVRAVNGGESGDSNVDLATTVIFTDDPLVGGTTLVKSVHISELRTAVNAVRTLAGIGAGSYTDPTLTAGVTPVKAAHINDLRANLDAARSALALSALSYGETVTGGTTTFKATHVSELRNGVK